MAMAALMLALPLSAARAYVFTTGTNGTGGHPTQTIYTETITSDGSTGPTGSGAPKSFKVNWSASTGGSTFVSATATFTILTFTTSELKFQVTLKNTSNFDSANTRLTAISLGLHQHITGVASPTGGAVLSSASLAAVPGLSGSFNACAFAGNNCSAGNAGLANGMSDTFMLDMTGASGIFGTPTSLAANIQVFGIKFAGSEPLSYELPGKPTPEPASLSLLVMALVGVAAMRPRRRAKLSLAA